MHVRKGTYDECEVRIDKYAESHCCDAKQWQSGHICLFVPHTHLRFLYCVTWLETKVFSCDNLSRVVRKLALCICENKDADQLRGNREADQRLCFRYTDSTIPLLLKYDSTIPLLLKYEILRL